MQSHQSPMSHPPARPGHGFPEVHQLTEEEAALPKLRDLTPGQRKELAWGERPDPAAEPETEPLPPLVHCSKNEQ